MGLQTPPKPVFALLDGNNFYVSCERVFRPDLRGHAVVVLSNNDGCAVARSNEARALGIKMGTPWHKIRDTLGDRVIALSSNYALYADMSDRMMSLAAGLGPTQEIYSIDECFIELTGVRGDLAARARAVRERILQWVGVPCGVGIGPTKTLAKLANHIAKTSERNPGSYPPELAQVCNLAAMPRADVDALLAATEVDEVWGIGRRLSEQLRERGVKTALDFARLDPAAVRAGWSVVLERTLRELQGVSCLDFEDAPPAKKEIACTRSFGRTVRDLDQLVEAISAHASRAAEKLRHQGSHAGKVMAFAHTSPFRPGPRFSRSVVTPLRRPTDVTQLIVQAAVSCIRALYQPGYDLVKCGVMLLELQPATREQFELGLDEDRRDSTKLMAALDRVNDRYGKGTLTIASAGIGEKKSWSMRRDRRTPEYTTNLQDMPCAKA